jgi:hypothetical protein
MGRGHANGFAHTTLSDLERATGVDKSGLHAECEKACEKLPASVKRPMFEGKEALFLDT